MCVHISIEVLAANAIIGLLKCTGERFVSFAKLDEYGVKVAKKLLDENETAYWIYTSEQIDTLFSDYSDMFERRELGGSEGIMLRQDITLKKLIAVFQTHLTWKLEQALMSPDVLEIFNKAA